MRAVLGCLRAATLAALLAAGAAPCARAAVPAAVPGSSAAPSGRGPAASQAGTAVAVHVSGNRALSSAEIRDAIGAMPASPDSAALAGAADRVLDRYRRAGYLWASAAVETGPSGGLSVSVEEGNLVHVGERRVLGAASLERDEIEAVLALRPGSAFSEEVLDADIRRLLDLYDERGFPFASVEAGGFRVSERGLLSFELRVTEGARAVVERVEPSGSDALRPQTLARLLGTRPGQPYDGRRLAEGRERLLRSGFYRTVGEVEVLQGSAPGRVVLRVPVSGAAVNSAQAIAGYSGSDKTLTGLFDLSLANIAGTARRGRVRWEGRGAGVSTYLLQYDEPWLFGSPLELRVALDHELHEPTFTRTVASAEFALPVSASLAILAGGSSERSVFPTGDRMKSSVLSTHAGFELDRRDRALNPREGERLRLLGRHGERKENYRAGAEVGTPPKTTLRGFEADYEAYRPVGGHQALALLGNVRYVAAAHGAIPEEERFPLGGAASLRGYREEQFRSSRVGLAQFEYRVLIAPDGTRTFIFTDVGYARPEDGATGTPFHVGYGVGLRVASKIGLVGVDYGLATGNGPLEGRIHFRLEAEF
jgi:outer membrane protein assembly factor BamA